MENNNKTERNLINDKGFDMELTNSIKSFNDALGILHQRLNELNEVREISKELLFRISRIQEDESLLGSNGCAEEVTSISLPEEFIKIADGLFLKTDEIRSNLQKISSFIS